MFTVRRELALRRNAAAPSFGEEPDDGKRWSDIGGVCGRIIRARSLTQPPVTIYCSPPLSANHYSLIISDIATCPSLSLVPYWQMNSLCPGAH